MAFKKNLNNVYVIDTNMFGYPEYMSAYLIEGKELAMVDTGLPNQFDHILRGIEEHGFSPKDISYIFLTHCEHPDHSGNVAPLLDLSPKAKAYINPVGLKNLLDPSIQADARKATLPEKMWRRFGTTLPVSRDRIELIADNDVIDLGNDVRLKFMFTPAHQPSGYIIFDEKNESLFINDLAGNYFEDCDYCLNLHPPDSDFFAEYEILQHIAQLPLKHLYLSHYGILENAGAHLNRALKRMEEMIEIGKKCIEEDRPEDIAKIIHQRNQEEAKKLLRTRSNDLYQYAINEHIPPQAQSFAKQVLKRYKGNESM